MLLMDDEKKLLRDLSFAAERAERHDANERARKASGLTTDLERYENNLEYVD